MDARKVYVRSDFPLDRSVYEIRRTIRSCLKKNQTHLDLVVAVVYLTLMDPLHIQPGPQDRRNQTKSNPEHIGRKKAGKADIECNGQESSQQKTPSPGRDT